MAAKQGKVASRRTAVEKLFAVDRTIDYTVRQRFLVRAEDAEAAKELVDSFAEGTDWSLAASKSLGVLQLSDEMEQVENTCELVVVDGGADAPTIDASLTRLGIENTAQAMHALLCKIAATPAIYCAGTAALGMEVKALVEKLGADINEAQAALEDLTATV